MNESEKYIIGACLTDPGAIYQAQDYIHSPKLFTDGKARVIWQAMTRLNEKAIPIDYLAVSNEITAMKMAEAVPLAEVMEYSINAIGSSNMEYHCKICVEGFMARETVEISATAQLKAKDPGRDIFETIDETQSRLEELSANLIQGRPVKAGDIAPDRIKVGIDRVQRRKEAEAKGETFTDGIPTGIDGLDQILNGFLPGRFYVIAARPGMGKSAITMNNFAYHAGRLAKPSLFKSLEMPKEELVDRIICAAGAVDYGRFQKGYLSGSDIQALEASKSDLIQLPIYIEDTGGDSVLKIRAGVRKHKRELKIEMFVLDNLSLIREKGFNRENEMARISGGLKRLAIEMKIPVIGISHLNRKCEDRNVKSPMLSDLRDSGAIEQDADSVIFLYRPWYYGQEYTMKAHKNTVDNLASAGVIEYEKVMEEIAWIDVAKNRGLTTGKFPCRFVGIQTRFEDWKDARVRQGLGLHVEEQVQPSRAYNEPQDIGIEEDDDMNSFPF